MPQVTSPNEFYQIVTEGPSAQYVVPSALHNLPATVSATSNVTSSVILANGFSAISVALTSTQAGTLTVQRYVDTAGTEAQGAPVTATLVASTLAVINVNDGLPFQSFTVNVANSSGSSATLSGVQILLQSETAASQQARIFNFQNAATANGNGTTVPAISYDGALCLEIDNGAGTCTVTLQGSFDNFATAQSAQVVGLIQVSSNAAGTATGVTSRGLSTAVSIAANTSYSLQVNDIYPYYRAVISSASGLGAGTYFTGCTVNLYANPM